jgi:hypothetical protein
MTPIIAIAIVLAVVVACVVWAKQGRAAFDERFPPISDTEFLAKCPPVVNPVVALKVRQLIAKHFHVEYERVYPSTSLIEDIGAD